MKIASFIGKGQTARMKKKGDAMRHIQGPLFILIAAFFFSVMSLGVRLLSGKIEADVLVLFRAIFQVVLLLPWVREFIPKEGEWTKKMKLHLFRGVFGVISMVFLYVAMQRLPMALASLLTMTSVFWASFFAWIFLKETLSFKQILWGFLAFFGVIVALIPEQGSEVWKLDALGTFGGLMSGFCAGVAFAVLRQMRQSTGTKEIVFYFGMTGIILTIPYASMHFSMPSSEKEWLLVLFVGLSASIAQLCMTRGFKDTKASVASIVNMQQLTFTVLLGFIFLGENPPPHFLLGVVLVFAGLTGLLRRPREGAQNGV